MSVPKITKFRKLTLKALSKFTMISLEALGESICDPSQLQELVGNWKCYFYITDGWPVYPCLFQRETQLSVKLT
jgi:hypothetical protein